ncbi:MAG: membrane protein insertion efficiency factor YidD [Ruminococcus sp.]|nr:membrane protein insertion efficiency factor YidD [Ruminococcus sp.]
MKNIPIFFIWIYKKIISPLFPARCRYYPSCSSYSIEAFKKHGFFKGLILSVWRVLRCNPFSKGGVDYVPEKFSLIRKKHS